MPRIDLTSDEQIVLSNQEDYMVIYPMRVITANSKFRLSIFKEAWLYDYNVKNLETNAITKLVSPTTLVEVRPNVLVIWYCHQKKGLLQGKPEWDEIFVCAIGTNGNVAVTEDYKFWNEKRGHLFNSKKAALLQLIARYQASLPEFAGYFAQSRLPDALETDYA